MATSLGLTLPTPSTSTSTSSGLTGTSGTVYNGGLNQTPTLGIANQTNTTTPSSNLLSGYTLPQMTTSVNSGLTNNGNPILNSVPVNTTPTATNISTAKPLTIPTTNSATTTTASNALRATTDSYMATPPPSYDASTGFVTSYGLSQGAKPVQPNDPANQTAQAPTPSSNTGTSYNSGFGSVSSSSPLRDSILAKYLGLETQLGDQTQVRNDLNTQLGVDQKQQNYIDAFNQYQAKKVTYDQQIEAIRRQPGISTEQANAQINEIQQRNNADLANLAVITQAAQGNYQAAMDIVQRKMDAQFKPVQQQIDNLGQFLQLNNADLTSSQQIQLENQRFVMQNNLNALMSAKQSAHQFALQQGIQNPQILSAIDAAQTPAAVYEAVGGTANGLPGQTGESGISNINSQYQGYVSATQSGTQYVKQSKLSNLTPYQQQEAARQYSAAGIPVLTDDEASKIQNIDVTKQNLSQLQGVTQSILGSGLQGRTIGAVWNQISQALQLNPDIASFNSYRDTAINTIQALAGGTGSGFRLNQTEIETAASNIPKITDNLETANAKITLLNSFLDKWTNELLPGQTSSATSGSGLYNW